MHAARQCNCCIVGTHLQHIVTSHDPNKLTINFNLLYKEFAVWSCFSLIKIAVSE